MDNIELLKKKIGEIIGKSPVPEDPVHSKNTLFWLLRLRPDADEALRIAALAHDIERAIEDRKVLRVDYDSYDDFKEAHALNSAVILKKMMEDLNVDLSLCDDIYFLVAHHEKGGDERADLVKDADSISFFHTNLTLYLERSGIKETKRRCMWGLRKLPMNLRKIVAEFEFADEKTKSLISECLQEVEK
jgi:Domain of unknown function (DUF4202)